VSATVTLSFSTTDTVAQLRSFNTTDTVAQLRSFSTTVAQLHSAFAAKLCRGTTVLGGRAC
jgi:hypothetical protein